MADASLDEHELVACLDQQYVGRQRSRIVPRSRWGGSIRSIPSYTAVQCGSRLSRNAVIPSRASAMSAFMIITSRVWS
jgi:hypothetical protein